MKLDKKELLLYAVADKTSNTNSKFFYEIEESLKGGVTLLQLREKEASFEEFLNDAKQVKKLCDEYNVKLIINDNIYVAKEVCASGVHLGQSDVSINVAKDLLGHDKIIGISVHNIEEAQIAKESGADYLGVGAIFSTNTKLDAQNLNINILKEIKELVNLPVVAIGGINKNNMKELKATKIDGVALVSAIYKTPDTKTNTEELLKMAKECFNQIPVVLTIAGSDSSGGAGIQADIKTMTMHNIYAESVITAITAQNTMGVTKILNIESDLIKAQLDAVFNDIYPDAVKIGMLASNDIVVEVASALLKYQAKNIVLDPVMVATSGSNLTSNETVETVKKNLFPLATIITPNLYEAEVLANKKIITKQDMLKVAKIIKKSTNAAILIKGGHLLNDATDLLYISDDEYIYLEEAYINNHNTHGTGCTLSSAIAANLAKGLSIIEAVMNAKRYITGAIKANLDLGYGHGPLNHMYQLK